MVTLSTTLMEEVLELVDTLTTEMWEKVRRLAVQVRGRALDGYGSAMPSAGLARACASVSKGVASLSAIVMMLGVSCGGVATDGACPSDQDPP